MQIIYQRSIDQLRFLIKWISQYFSGKNQTPYCLAYSIQVLQAFSSVLQFSAAIGPYIIRFMSSTKPIPQVAPSLKELSRLLIKKRKSIGERGNPYSIPVVIAIGGLQYPIRQEKIYQYLASTSLHFAALRRIKNRPQALSSIQTAIYYIL